MDSPASLFEATVSVIFKKWHAIEFAISNASGGHATSDKINWLPYAYQQWLVENSDVDVYDVRDFLSAVLFDEFDLLIEDGSDSQVADQLFKAYTYYKGGCHNELKALRDEILSRQFQKVTFTAERGADQDDDDDDDSDCSDESDEEMAADSSAGTRNDQPTCSTSKRIEDSESAASTRQLRSSAPRGGFEARKSTQLVVEAGESVEEGGDVEMGDIAEWNVVQSNRKKRKN